MKNNPRFRSDKSAKDFVAPSSKSIPDCHISTRKSKPDYVTVTRTGFRVKLHPKYSQQYINHDPCVVFEFHNNTKRTKSSLVKNAKPPIALQAL